MSILAGIIIYVFLTLGLMFKFYIAMIFFPILIMYLVSNLVKINKNYPLLLCGVILFVFFTKDIISIILLFYVAVTVISFYLYYIGKLDSVHTLYYASLALVSVSFLIVFSSGDAFSALIKYFSTKFNFLGEQSIELYSKFFIAGLISTLIHIWCISFIILYKKGMFQNEDLLNWKIDHYIIWIVIVLLSSILIGRYLKIDVSIFVSLLLIVSVFYFYQGLSLLFYAIQKQSNLVKNLVFVISLVFLGNFISLLGLIDVWGNFRSIFKKEVKK